MTYCPSTRPDPDGDGPRQDPPLETTLGGLTAGLRAHARGVCRDMAAVELVIAHGFWLTRPDFTARYVRYGHALTGRGVRAAWIDWDAAVIALNRGALPCSSGEEAVLRIAAALGASGVFPVALLSRLDARNLALAAEAVAHAGGYPGSLVVIR